MNKPVEKTGEQQVEGLTNQNKRTISVYCGSGSGNNEIFLRQARELGRLIARDNIKVVYGGASIGLMGEIANSVLHYGGEVIGVIPQKIVDLEIAHPHLTDLKIVNGMHERKAMMAELGDAFIALPGGFGTLDEIFEMLTWSQLGLHQKPCGLLSTNGYFDDILSFFKNAQENGFIRDEHRELLTVRDTPEQLLQAIQERWMQHPGKEVNPFPKL